MGTYEELIPKADMVLNLTPDKQHTSVVTEARAARLCACPLATMPHAARCASTACVGAVQVMPLMKKNAVLAYSHGFNIVEEGMKIRKDLTVLIHPHRNRLVPHLGRDFRTFRNPARHRCLPAARNLLYAGLPSAPTI